MWNPLEITLFLFVGHTNPLKQMSYDKLSANQIVSLLSWILQVTGWCITNATEKDGNIELKIKSTDGEPVHDNVHDNVREKFYEVVTTNYLQTLHNALLRVVTPRRIVGWRKKKNLDVPEVAKISGISERTINRYEKGETKPRLAPLSRLYNAMKGKEVNAPIQWHELNRELHMRQ